MARNTLPSQQYLRECLDYAPATGVLIWRLRPAAHFPSSPKRAGEAIAANWNARRAGKVAGSVGHHGYIRVGIGNKHFWAHRLIWRLMTSEDPFEVDHRNGNGSDNRFDNLRAASHSQNGKNHSGWSGRQLPKGVSVADRKFRARICVDGKQMLLGRYTSPEQASAAYREAAARLHGEFANFGRGDQ